MENFYVLYGEPKEIVQQEYQKLIKKLKTDDIVKYDMTTTDLTEVIDDAKTVGMFSSHKIITLDNSNFLIANKTINNIEELENYIEHYNPDNYIIFLVYNEKIDSRKKINKLLSKHTVIAIKQEEKDLNNYIEEYLKENKYKIENINYFINKVGTSLYNIKNELDKLIMYKIEDKYITNEDIDKISIKNSEEEIFVLTDTIIEKNTSKSLNLFETFLNKGYDEIQILNLLASQFRFFFQVKRLQNKNKTDNEIAHILEANPYRVKFTTRKLYTYTELDILNIIKRLAQIDHDIKLGLMDKKLALELFLTTNG